jgi:tRNA (adenine-N(1)-)-methyltransferase non-catalytic subunit
MTKNSNILTMSDPDPFLTSQSTRVQEGEFVLLVFADNRYAFAQALKHQRGKSPSVKINKRSYSTCVLVGLPYGTVLELNKQSGLVPLEEGEDVLPDYDDLMEDDEDADFDKVHNEDKDNRHLVDDNTSQAITAHELHKMKDDPGLCGAKIVKTIVKNSASFNTKTSFSKAKYIKKKQMKYQPRCRLVRCTSSSICQALFLKDPRKIMNLREDALAQILSYSNISAGSKVLCFETTMGLVTGACAQRMGGYGTIHSIYTGNAPPFMDMIARFNLSFVEHSSIKWVHAGYLFHDKDHPEEESKGEDLDLAERNRLVWPCPLQQHTEDYLLSIESEKKQREFLQRRCARFARKLTRPTPDENAMSIMESEKKCDSLILACTYDPKSTLFTLLPYLETSCPFVIFCEYMEPLYECFQKLQNEKLAINLRLSDTWMREYQVLPNRTHPNMNMSQNGGFILTGVKLCPVHGKNELDDDLMKEIRLAIGGRRGKKRKQDVSTDSVTKKSRRDD